VFDASNRCSGGIDEASRAWKVAPSINVDDTEAAKRDVDYFMMTYEQVLI
jgi:hypothetical protein